MDIYDQLFCRKCKHRNIIKKTFENRENREECLLLDIKLEPSSWGGCRPQECTDNMKEDS